MKRCPVCLRYVVFLLCLLLLPAKPGVAEDVPGGKDVSPMRVMLNEYRQEKYSILGPVQYLGRDTETIDVFRYGRIPYRILDMKGESGGRCYLKESDYVYVASKDGHVVLLCVSREGRNVK